MRQVSGPDQEFRGSHDLEIRYKKSTVLTVQDSQDVRSIE